MLRFLKIIVLFCLIMLSFNRAQEFIADSEDTSASGEEAEDVLVSPQITHDMLMHRNPTVSDNDLKDLWEKLPDYELTDIKK
ncbi:uncharacterized protein LOC142229169 [Haematobia irritans]|uniref:uncharacterized protein LOC142229169 n=1 Tax=Haematobia irritans TaxID=7368 RepID=UPI003F4F4CA1